MCVCVAVVTDLTCLSSCDPLSAVAMMPMLMILATATGVTMGMDVHLAENRRRVTPKKVVEVLAVATCNRGEGGWRFVEVRIAL